MSAKQGLNYARNRVVVAQSETSFLYIVFNRLSLIRCVKQSDDDFEVGFYFVIFVSLL